MTSQLEPGECENMTHCRLDLDQVRSAVKRLRASSPRSALADLAEAKLRAIENGIRDPWRGEAESVGRRGTREDNSPSLSG
jgi:hypothetical protein